MCGERLPLASALLGAWLLVACRTSGPVPDPSRAARRSNAVERESSQTPGAHRAASASPRDETSSAGPARSPFDPAPATGAEASGASATEAFGVEASESGASGTEASRSGASRDATGAASGDPGAAAKGTSWAGSVSDTGGARSAAGGPGPKVGSARSPSGLASDRSPLPAPERVLVLGDSMIVTELGRDLARRFQRSYGAQVVRRGKSSTGLARPDFFDWFREGARLARKIQPDVVLVIVGGNDGQDLLDPEGRGRVRWRSEDWPARYAERVHRFLDAMAAPGRHVVWVELPAMEHRRLEGKLRLIRRVQSEALADRTDVALQVDHRRCFYDGSGQMLTEVPAGPGRGRPIRQEDGIHLTLAGARYVARCVFPEISALFRAERPS
ncbi:MAG TPA: DUF459 domain-containing protein [Myxococcales bacterium LLY-WYZ-16_1]|nr:DUF459 domain-containing protein [Myxococcales bacterium LLY-WYZ-16_1]